MSLQDRLDQESTYWEPEAGDSLIGTVVGLATRSGDYGDYPVVTVRTPAGAYIEVSGMRSVLREKIYEKDLQVGDEVGFKYEGEKESKKGTKYHSYRVVSEWGPDHRMAGSTPVSAPATETAPATSAASSELF